MATIPQHSGYSVITGSGTGPNGDRIDVWIEWRVTEQEIDNNRSYVRAYFYAALKSGYTTSTWGGSGCYSSFSVGGVSGTGLKNNGAYDFRSPSIVNSLGTFAGWVNHKSDGTKSVTFSGSFTTSSSWITGGSASGSRSLPTIPRATTPGVSSMTMGTETTIDLSSRASSSFTHTLKYKFVGASGTIVTKTSSTSYKWTPGLSLANQVPSSTSGSIEITCETYSGSTLVGTKKVTKKLSVPASVKPSVSGLSVTRINSNPTIAGWGVFVQGFSKVKLTASASGAYGSTIRNYYFAVKVGGSTKLSASQTGSSWTSGYLTTASTSYTFYVKVTDSRGRTDTYTTGTYTVYAYNPPSVSLTDAFRCTSSGTKDLTDGTYISAKFTSGASSVGGHNVVTKKIEYRRYKTSTWYLGKDNPSNGTYYVFGGGDISTLYSYEVRFSVTDSITGMVAVTKIVKPGRVTLHVRPGGLGIGIGGAADANEFQCYRPAVFKSTLKVNTDTVWHTGNLHNSTGYCDLYLYGSSTAGNPKYSVQYSEYTRVGDQVDVSFRFVLTSLGGMDGSIYVGNLPFEADSTASSSATALNVSNITRTNLRAVMALVQAGSTYARLRIMYEASGTMVEGALSASHMADDSAIQGIISYKAA
jgi:hypothetical protein